MNYKFSEFNFAIIPDSELPYKKIVRDEVTCLDDNNVPLRNWKGKLLYHPVFMIDHALHLLNVYEKEKDDAILKQIDNIANKIVGISVKYQDALWIPYPFDFQLHGRNEMMQSTWYSAMSQGMALSLFSRLYRLTYIEEFLDVARALFKSFIISKEVSPFFWVSCVDENSYLWLEEYPIETKDHHTLNGMIFAIFGLYDWFLINKGDQHNLLAASITTIKENIEKFRVAGSMSYYCLLHKVQDRYYHRVHAEQLLMLSKITNDNYFAEMSALFLNDH